MSDIFICYSRTDSTVASQLAERLRAEGWSVFMDVQTHVGRRWHREIEKELHAAKAVVVLWSARSGESDFVLEEAEYGRRKEILFPAFIERVEFPYGFGRIQTADLIGWVGAAEHPGLAQLLEPLKEHLNSREATPGSGDVLHTDVVVTSKPAQPAPARVIAIRRAFVVWRAVVQRRGVAVGLGVLAIAASSFLIYATKFPSQGLGDVQERVPALVKRGKSALADRKLTQPADENALAYAQLERRVEPLLEKARQGLAAGRLTEPLNDNAMSHARGVLSLAPGHAEAREILAKVLRGSVVGAEKAVAEGGLTRAKALRETARSLVEQYGLADDELALLERRIAEEERRQAEREARLGDEARVELAFWDSIKDSRQPSAYREYLHRFPEGNFAGLARLKLNEISSESASDKAARHRAQKLSKAEPKYTTPITTLQPRIRSGVAGLWEGQYRCQDEAIGFSLDITKPQGSDITAVFEFFALPGSLSFPRGKFSMSGHFDPVGKKISLESGEWIKRPLGFERHDIEGQLEASGSQITGRILTTGCAEFVLKARR